jgi:type I restriction enzyme S subunit
MSGPYPYFGPTGVLDHINEFRYEGEFALIGEDGDHFLKFARQPMTLIASGRFNVNNHAHVIGNRDGNSVHWFQRFFEHRDITQNLTRQGAGRYKLTKATLEKLPLAIPPPPEQRAITKAIDDTAQLVDRLEALISKKQAIKQGMMQQLLTGRTRLPGYRDEWSDAAIADVAIVDPEALASSSNPAMVIDYISLEDVSRGALLGHTQIEFRSAPSRARRVIREYDILFGTVRPNLQSHMLYRGGLNNPIASTGFGVVRASAKADPRFLFYLLMSDLTRSQVDRIIAGSNYPAVSSGDVRKLTFVIPHVEEQRAIGSALLDTDIELSALRARLNKAIAIKTGMMQQLLSGRTRLPVPERAA